jgi:peptide/nickel transport system permease protein
MPEPLSDTVSAAAVPSGITPAGSGGSLSMSEVALDSSQDDRFDIVVAPVSAPPGITGPGVIAVSPIFKKKLGVVFWLSVGWVVAIAFGAIFAGLLPIPDPTHVAVTIPGSNPSLHHLLGGDELGRDLLSRIIYGARVSLTVGVVSLSLAFLFGGTLGLLAGYYRGKVDTVISAATNIVLAFPQLILALAIVAFLGQSLTNVVVVIGFLGISPVARLVRGNTVLFAQREFVLAARMLGAKTSRIIFREVLANVVPAAVALALAGVGVAILAEGGLAFLGLSVRPPSPSWGGMISEGRQVLQQHPLIAIWPMIFMFLTVIAFNFIGDKLQAHFDVKEGAL